MTEEEILEEKVMLVTKLKKLSVAKIIEALDVLHESHEVEKAELIRICEKSIDLLEKTQLNPVRLISLKLQYKQATEGKRHAQPEVKPFSLPKRDKDEHGARR